MNRKVWHGFCNIIEKFFEIKNKSRFAHRHGPMVAGTETKSATKYKIAASAGVLNGIRNKEQVA